MIFFMTHYEIESKTLKKQNRNSTVLNVGVAQCVKRAKNHIHPLKIMDTSKGIMVCQSAVWQLRGVAAALELAVSMRHADVGGIVLFL